MTKIAVLVGSLHKNSVNQKLAQNLEKFAGDDVEFDYVDIAGLPPFNQDLEAKFPVEAQAMKDKIEAADGVLLVTPEYNRSFSGVLKNAIDWASRPWGSNSFDGKPAGIVGASISPLGTAAAQAALRQVMVYLNTKLMGQPEVYLTVASDTFDDNGNVADRHVRSLTGHIDTFVAHIAATK